MIRARPSATTAMPLEPIDDAVDHVHGPAHGPTLLVYGDYECPYTRKAIREIERLQSDDPGVRLVFRNFPLTEIHPHALAAATAAEAAELQGRFWDMHDLLFHRQHALGEDDLARYAAELGLDAERFARDRASEAVLARIRRDVDSGEAAGVMGTPSFFIAGRPYDGSYQAADLARALAQSD
jgi:protein-disulfide isomerase